MLPAGIFTDTPTLIGDWLIVWPLILPLLGAALLLMLRSQSGLQAPFAALVLVVMLVTEGMLAARVLADGPVAMTMSRWLPPFGISFAADMLSASFAFVAGIVALFVLAFAQTDVEPRETRNGFYPLLLVLMAGVNGAFLTGDIFNLYVWLEVVLIAAFGLISIGGRKLQLDGAVKYGFISLLGTTLFLVAVALLYGLTGTLNMADLIRLAPNIDARAGSGIAALFLLALGIKAAAFPVNTWLPASYHTPGASVSALFGALLTKVGVYAILRILAGIIPLSMVRDVGYVGWPGFGFDFSLSLLLGFVAGATLILAPLGAIAETNIRRAVGFLLIGGIGASLAGLGMYSFGGIQGAAMYALHSMLTLTALYFTAGVIERQTGTTDTRKMGGLYHYSSPLSILFLVLALGIAGMPPFLGFWAKFALVQAGASSREYWLVTVILINAFLTVIAMGRLWSHIFWRNGREGDPSEAPNANLRPLNARDRVWGFWPAAVLTAGIVLLGFFPQPLATAGFVAAQTIVDSSSYVSAVAPAGVR